MKPSIALRFDGHCAAAFEFYERLLAARTVFKLTWGDSPLAGEAPAHWHSKICHATLVLAATTFNGCDVLPGTYEPPRGVSIVLNIDDLNEADRLFAGLAEHGEIRVAPRETFWARRYATVVDQFGIEWEINAGHSHA